MKLIHRKVVFILLILSFVAAQTKAQQLSNPFDFPIQLSGGFCDLRANHYHAGIDFRTKSSEGHAMHAVLPGYISRVSVSPWGYGLAVYITHPDDSLITVYAHLQRFTPEIQDIVRKEQYEKEKYDVDIKIEPNVLPVKRRGLIGYSGNSGNSGGPHLHFEVRDMRNGDILDPLAFFKSNVPDKRKPLVRGLMVYPMEGKGIVNGSSKKQNIGFKLDKNDNPTVTTVIEAWGEIGLGIRAIDRMDGTNFSYGIRDILKTVDSVETYRSYTDRFSPSESRYINSYTDYEEWSNKRIFYIKTFVEPGNLTRFIASRNSGRINITEERIYNVVITLTDIYGNTSKVPIKIMGKKQEIAPPDTVGTRLLRWHDYNSFSAKGIRMTIPRGSLYSNVYMHYDSLSTGRYYSSVHTLHRTPVPLHNPAQLSIHMDSVPTSISTDKLGIIHIANLSGRISWIGGTYRDGWIDAEIKELGRYTVTHDTIPPVIKPIAPDKWRERKKISFNITDNLSGISTYKGEIDGKFVLFEYDGKNALITYSFDKERLHSNYNRFKLTVTDRCGNESVYEYSFAWQKIQ